MKKLIFGLALMGLTSGVQAVANNSPSDQFLFVQTAGSAEIKAIPHRPNTYDLTLAKVAPYVTYFADRPIRASGVMSSYKFSQRWQKGFQHDSPNADLVGVEGSFVHHNCLNYTVELSSMQYAATQTVHYVMHALPGNKKALPVKLALHDAALFIDGFCLDCG